MKLKRLPRKVEGDEMGDGKKGEGEMGGRGEGRKGEWGGGRRGPEMGRTLIGNGRKLDTIRTLMEHEYVYSRFHALTCTVLPAKRVHFRNFGRFQPALHTLITYILTAAFTHSYFIGLEVSRSATF